jgi:hypothetical protein
LLESKYHKTRDGIEKQSCVMRGDKDDVNNIPIVLSRTAERYINPTTLGGKTGVTRASG